MPDWFYRTVSRPLLFRLPAEISRRFAVGFMGTVGRLPFGSGGLLIDFLGHLHPPTILQQTLGKRRIAGPVGLGHLVDPEGRALRAWDHFGFGFLEVGPIRSSSVEPSEVDRDLMAQAITRSLPQSGVSAPDLAQRLQRDAPQLTTPVWIRGVLDAKDSPASQAQWLAATLMQFQNTTVACSLELEPPTVSDESSWKLSDWIEFWSVLQQERSKSGDRLEYWWVCTIEELETVIAGRSSWDGLGIDGWVIENRERQQDKLVHGARSSSVLLQAITRFRETFGDRASLVVSGGIHQPSQAIGLLKAGARAVRIDTGFVFSGPGLPKRINEAVEVMKREDPPKEGADSQAWSFRDGWPWTLLLGVGMFLGSLLAIWFATTRVVLPYDEVFCGLSRAQLAELHPRLLPFMAHDRFTLAGTMVTIGSLYMALSWFGIRRGLHWCRTAVLASAGIGFASFFLFLGFDYFDPFHAFVCAILFQLFVQGIVGRFSEGNIPPSSLDLDETCVWRRGQWGQFLQVIHGSGLIIAGAIISAVGIGKVLVESDERYLGTSVEALQAAGGRILPLIAHDRATLGGMLIASGVLYLLASLWGMR